MNQVEAVWIEQLKAGEEKAYQYLYDHHYAVLCHIAESYVKDRFAAEMIVGDVIFHVWEIRKSLQIVTSIRSYLAQAVRNRCINLLTCERERREVAFSSLPDDVDMEGRPDLSSEEHPLGILLEQELEEEISRAIDSMPDECHRIFLKSRFEGKTYEEISQELGVSVNTVKYHIKNALAFLHKALGKYLLFFF